MKRLSILLLFFLGVLALGQPEEFRDLGFGNKPFNPGDVGLVMRALIRDNDPADIYPIYFTRVSLENLGTAAAEDIEWVELRLENSCGKTAVLVWGTSFPLQAILLNRPPEERMILDDGEAYLYVWAKVTERITEGRTIQPKITLGWAEGDKGGTLELVDSAPEKLVVAGSFSARALTGPEGGNLNPGDRFPVAEVEVEDTADVNPWGLDVVKVRLDGPTSLVWILDNGVTKLTIPAGRDFGLPEPLFAALDEAKGKLTLWVEVPENFRPTEPVQVAPTITLTLQESSHSQTFKLTDPVADRVLAAGLEIVEIQVPQAGKVLSPSPTTLLYSTLKLGDQDRNATPVRLDSFTLKPLGTLTAVASVEVVDQGGRLVGFGQELGKPIPFVSPDGKPLLLPDEATWTLNFTLTISGKIPLGASLLLSHELAVEEVLPREYLARSDALTRFKGTHTVSPKEAVFFGKPTFKLAKVEERAVFSTDGETLGLIAGKLSVKPAEFVEVKAQALAAYRLTTQVREDGLSFTLEGGKAQAKAGDLAAFAPVLKPVRVPAKEMDVTLDLRVEKAVDWAGISLPFTLGPSQALFKFVVPQVGILPTPERKDAAVIHVDVPVLALRAYVYFDPKVVELSQVQGLEPYKAEIVAEEEPQPGRALLAITLQPEKQPASGHLASLVFTKKAKEEIAVSVKLEVLEVLGPEGTGLPYYLDPEVVELQL
ncbi:hypothetical protein H5T56_04650 [Candidatus Bipolaricaulota bacterium]|nr:hypothetical protein [Candidatus Bipolaricaulota bacterium]